MSDMSRSACHSVLNTREQPSFVGFDNFVDHREGTIQGRFDVVCVVISIELETDGSCINVRTFPKHMSIGLLAVADVLVVLDELNTVRLLVVSSNVMSAWSGVWLIARVRDWSVGLRMVADGGRHVD